MSEYVPKSWIVVGSSPSVTDYFQRVVQNHLSESTTITCNAGILLFEDWNFYPDHYLLIDGETVRLFLPQIEMMRAKQVNLITSKAQIDGLVASGLEGGVHELIEYEPAETSEFVRGRYVNVRMSGLFACQYAIMNGARKVVLVGMDGYTGPGGYEPTLATFDGRLGLNGLRTTLGHIAPFVQSMVTACPDVEFVQYGEPKYEISGGNYHLVGAKEPASCR